MVEAGVGAWRDPPKSGLVGDVDDADRHRRRPCRSVSPPAWRRRPPASAARSARRPSCTSLDVASRSGPGSRSPSHGAHHLADGGMRLGDAGTRARCPGSIASRRSRPAPAHSSIATIRSTCCDDDRAMPPGDRAHRDVVLLVRARRDRVDRRRVRERPCSPRPGPRPCTGGACSPARAPSREPRNAGSPPLRLASSSRAVRRSLIEPSSASASFAKSSASATGSPWKLPPRDDVAVAGRPRIGVCDAAARGRSSGLSVAAFISIASTRRGGPARRARRRGPGARSGASTGPGPCAAAGGATLDRAVAEQPAQLRGDRDLAGVRPRRWYAVGERDVRAEQRLDDIAAATLAVRSSRSASASEQRAERGHQLRAVEEREALLRAEAQRLEAGLAQRDERRHRRARRAPPARAR